VPHPKIKKKGKHHYTLSPVILILSKGGFLLSKVISKSHTEAMMHVLQIVTYAIGTEHKVEQR